MKRLHLLLSLVLVITTAGFDKPSFCSQESSPQNISMQQLVHAAMESARKEGSSGFGLVLAGQLDAKKALPYVTKYVSDTNPDVRRAVMHVARMARSDEGYEVLASLVADNSSDDVGDDAARGLFLDCDAEQIRSLASRNKGLKHSLLNAPLSGHTVMLLSCFTGDKKVIVALEKKRQELRTYRKNAGKPWPTNLGHGWMGDANVVNDVALAELGQQGALGRVLSHIRQSDVDNIVLLFDALRFIKSRDVNYALADLLKNDTVVPMFTRGLGTVRVCDIACVAFIARSQKEPFYLMRRVSNDEITETYLHLQSRYSQR